MASFAERACGFGRGSRLPPFNWLEYSQKIIVSSGVATQGRMKWMTAHYYCYLLKKYHGKDETVALDEFQNLTETLPRSRVETSGPDGTEILMPKDRLVLANAERKHEECTQLGMKR